MNISVTSPNFDCLFQVNFPLFEASKNLPILLETSIDNEELPEEILLKKLIDSGIIDSQFFINEQLTINPLPNLKKQQILSLCTLLNQPRIFRGRHCAFEVSFTLLELFTYLIQKKKNIVQIELIGSGVPWCLEEYALEVLCKLGLKSIEKTLAVKLISIFNRYPSDFDFRIILTPNKNEDLQNSNEFFLDFLVEKASRKSLLSPSELKSIIIKTGFTKFSPPIFNDDNYCLTVGLKDESGDCFDFIFVEKLKRQSLFIHDSVRIPILELIQSILNNSFSDIYIIPLSDFRNGYQAIIDRLTGIVRAIHPETIDTTGWSLLLSSYVKGKRSLNIELELTFFKKLQTTSNVSPLSYLLPTTLQKILSKTSPSDQLDAGIAFYLEKAISNHLKGNSTAALLLTLQASISLCQLGLTKEMNFLWVKMEKFFKSFKEGEFEYALYQGIMNAMPDLFTVISLLEVKAMLYMSVESKDSQNENIRFNFIHHQGQNAIRMSLQGFSVLLPCNLVRSLKNVAASKDSLQILSERLSIKLPYINKPQRQRDFFRLNLHELENILEEILQLEHLTLGQRDCLEGLLAYSLHFTDFYANHILESVFPTFIFQFPTVEERMRVLKSYINKSHLPAEHHLYSQLTEIIQDVNMSLNSFLLSWSLALSTTQNPSKILKAYQIWEKIPDDEETQKKVHIGFQIIIYVGSLRPDLALAVWKKVANFKSQKDKEEIYIEVQLKIFDILLNLERINEAVNIFTQILKNHVNQINQNLLYQKFSEIVTKEPFTFDEFHLLIKKPKLIKVLRINPTESAKKLLDLLEKSSPLDLNISMNLLKILISLTSVLSKSDNCKISLALIKFLQCQSIGNLLCDNDFIQVINENQNFLLDKNLYVENVIFGGLFHELAKHKISLQLNSQTLANLCQFLQTILDKNNKELVLRCLNSFLWMLENYKGIESLEPLTSYYYNLMSFLYENKLHEQLCLFLEGYLILTERSRFSSIPQNYVHNCMNWFEVLEQYNHRFSYNIINHILAITQENYGSSLQRIFKTLDTSYTSSPLKMIILLERHSKIFLQYLSIQETQKLLMNLSLQFLESKNFELLKILLVLMKHNYKLSFNNWKLIIKDASKFDNSLRHVITHYLFLNIDEIFNNAPNQTDGIQFCELILEELSTTALCGMLGIAKKVLEKFNDPTRDLERITFIDQLFTKAANDSIYFPREYLHQYLDIWLNAYKPIESYLKVTQVDFALLQHTNLPELQANIEKKEELYFKLEQLKLILIGSLGTDPQFEMLTIDLVNYLNLFSTSKVEVIGWFMLFYIKLSERRRIQITPIFFKWLDQHISLFYSKKTNSNLILDFFNTIPLSMLEVRGILDSLYSSIHPLLWEEGCLIAFNFLDIVNVQKNEKKKFVIKILHFLEKIDRHNIITSINFFMMFFKKSIPPITEFTEHISIYNLLFKILNHSLSVIGESLKFNSIHISMEFVKGEYETLTSDQIKESAPFMMIDLMDKSAFVIYKNPTLYEPCIKIYIEKILEIYRLDPPKFDNYLNVYIKDFSKTLNAIFKSEKCARAIFDPFFNQLLTKFYSCIEFESEYFESSLKVIDELTLVIIRNHLYQNESKEFVIERYVFMPISDKFPLLQKNIFFTCIAR